MTETMLKNIQSLLGQKLLHVKRVHIVALRKA